MAPVPPGTARGGIAGRPQQFPCRINRLAEATPAGTKDKTGQIEATAFLFSGARVRRAAQTAPIATGNRNAKKAGPGTGSASTALLDRAERGRCSPGVFRMLYCFSVRFRFARPIPSFPDKIEEEFRLSTFKRPLQLARAYGMNIGWLVIESCGYADYAEAKASGELFHDGLLIVAANQKVGVEFYLRIGHNGIHVYPGGQLEIGDPGLPQPTPLTKHDLKATLETAIGSATSLTENQRVAGELLNDSMFNMTPEASFLLRVSAIEALCPQPGQTEAFKTMVTKLIASIPDETEDEDRDQVEQALKMLAARKSVRSACRSKIKEMIGADKAKQFDTLYNRRSKFLHNGDGRGNLDRPANDALELGLELLLADMRQTASCED
jgi:hypothetical protein